VTVTDVGYDERFIAFQELRKFCTRFDVLKTFLYSFLQHFFLYICCIHITSDIARRQHLRSAGSHQLFVYSLYLDTGVRCSVVGPYQWLARQPDSSRSFGSFRRELKNFSFLVLLAYAAH